MKHVTRLGPRLTLTIIGCGVLLSGIAVAAGTAVTLNGGDTAALSCAGASLSIQTANKTSANVSCVPSSTPTPPTTPPPTTPPPPPGTFAPGENVHASNTGYAGDGLTAANLTPVSGSVTYGSAFNGQTISGKAYSDTINLTGSNITVKDCSLTYSGRNAFGFNIYGTNNHVDHCTVTSPAGGEMYEPMFIQPGSTGAQVTYDDISRGENLITTYGASPMIANDYLHDSCGCGDPDGIELYGGSNVTIQNNRIDYGGMYEAPINIAPWSNYKVQGALIQGNYLDHGQSIMIIDNQNTSCSTSGSPGTGTCLNDVVVERNAMGGHQCPSSNSQCFHTFHATLNDENRPFVQTDAQEAANPNAVEWPTTGDNVNRWEESADIETASTPKDGDVAIPGGN